MHREFVRNEIYEINVTYIETDVRYFIMNAIKQYITVTENTVQVGKAYYADECSCFGAMLLYTKSFDAEMSGNPIS